MRTVELRVLCEGATERNFVSQVLKPHLRPLGVFAKAEGLVGPLGGGVVPFEVLRDAIKRDLGRSREHQYLTTMIDLYKLGEYPGTERRSGESVAARVGRIQAAMLEGLANPRFIPHVQVHEFEALVFVDLDRLPGVFPDNEARGAVEALRAEVRGLAPEEIDEGEHTAPSKRLIRAIPQYKDLKASIGPTIAHRIGITRLRAACPHFSSWIARLEGLAEASQ